MAGILANSATETMVDGETSADNSHSGYITKERITLSVTGSPTTVQWALAKPTTSGSICRLDDDEAFSPSFVPDVGGYYVVTCVLDGSTSYVLRIAAADVSLVSTITSIRFPPVANASVPAPAAGVTLFYSADDDALSVKLPDGTVSAV